MLIDENDKILVEMDCWNRTTYETGKRYGDAIEIRLIWDKETQLIPRPPFKLYNIETLGDGDECVEIPYGDGEYLIGGGENMCEGKTFTDFSIADYKQKLLIDELDDYDLKWLKMMISK